MNVLFETESGCHVFQLPPSNPMLAASWEGHHIWSGGVRVVQEQSPSSSLLLSVQLFESDTRELFGQCPMDHPDALRRATDSSRCFVVKVVQGSQFAFVGLMFDKSNDGSQFGAVVADTQRAKERHEAALREASQQQEAQPVYGSTAFASSGVRDRGGPLLRLELGGKLQSGSSTSSSLQAASVSLSCPPKASGSSRRVQSTPTQPPPSSTPTFSTTNVSSSPSSTSSARPPPPSSTAAAALPQPATAKSTATTTSSAGGGDALDALLGGASTAQRETSSSSSVPPPKRNTLDELFL